MWITIRGKVVLQSAPDPETGETVIVFQNPQVLSDTNLSLDMQDPDREPFNNVYVFEL